jgi:hypothetical protein
VHAEEARVEAEAEDDLGRGGKQQQQGEVAVVGRGEQRQVDRQQREIDQVREDVRGPVDRGLGDELPERPAGQTRPLSDVK